MGEESQSTDGKGNPIIKDMISVLGSLLKSIPPEVIVGFIETPYI